MVSYEIRKCTMSSGNTTEVWELGGEVRKEARDGFQEGNINI